MAWQISKSGPDPPTNLKFRFTPSEVRTEDVGLSLSGSLAAGSTATGWRRPMRPRPLMLITTVPCWLVIEHPMKIVPRSAWRAEGLVSRISTAQASLSPGRTGSNQRICSIPDEPRLSARLSTLSIHTRAHAAHVCHPLAMRPPKGEYLAASGSMWKYCGSKRRPKSMISASVIS